MFCGRVWVVGGVNNRRCSLGVCHILIVLVNVSWSTLGRRARLFIGRKRDGGKVSGDFECVTAWADPRRGRGLVGLVVCHAVSRLGGCGLQEGMKDFACGSVDDSYHSSDTYKFGQDGTIEATSRQSEDNRPSNRRDPNGALIPNRLALSGAALWFVCALAQLQPPGFLYNCPFDTALASCPFSLYV